MNYLIDCTNFNVACYIGGFFVEMMGHAEVSIFAPSILIMNMILLVTSKFGNEFDLKFNPEKTLLLTFNYHNDPSIYFRFNGRVLQMLAVEAFLGII